MNYLYDAAAAAHPALETVLAKACAAAGIGTDRYKVWYRPAP